MNRSKKHKYIVYIDESNILSKIGNSVYVCLYIEFLCEIDISRKIINIERDLKLSYIHWVDMPWKLRIKFAEKIKDLDFICKVMIFKNPIIQEEILRRFLFKVIKNEDNIYKITIDGKKSKRYENKLKTILKNQGLKFHKIKFMDDKKVPLVRLTDFIAGLLRSFVDNKNENNTYIYGLLKHKIKIPD